MHSSYVGVFKSMKKRLAEYAEEKYIYTILIGKPEGKIPLETPRNTWKDDIVTYSGFA
jgi:hypothetical protein